MADLDDKQASATIKITGANTSGDESNYVKVSANQDIGVIDTINTSGIYKTLTVTTTAIEVKVGASRLADRKLVTLDNTSNNTLYWGYDSSVTTSNFCGRIFKDQQASWGVGANVSIFVIAPSGSNAVQISEGA